MLGRGLVGWVFLTLGVCLAPPGPGKSMLTYAPAPVDNPLKGLVPYAGEHRDRFPHSLEFNYLALSDLVKGPDTYDWKPLEKLLNDIAGRGHQAIFRVYLEYPGKTGILPKFLLDAGLKVHRYINTNTQPLPPQPVETPDYENPLLRRTLQRFIAALGQKYDGDPRIGFITAGLLGTWGEWHTHPRHELFASKTVQREIMDAYQQAFQTTPVLLRYPAGPKTRGKAANADRPFGYHDDSFAWATLDTGQAEDAWFFMPALHAAGPAAVNKWQTQPIGGEIRPEAWGQVFDAQPRDPQVQDFLRCVEATHVTWLMDSGMFESWPAADRVARATAAVRRMGYEYHVASVTLGVVAAGELPVTLTLENRGVAPFYYAWPVEYALLAGGQPVAVARGTGTLKGLLPGKTHAWHDRLRFTARPGDYQLAVRVRQPLTNGKPLRFANATQDADAPGWLTLAPVRWP